MSHSKFSKFWSGLKRQNKIFILNNSSSNWCDVDSGVLQWSLFGFLLFVFHINDLTDHLTHWFKRYADDGKLIVELRADRDDGDMQSDINKIVKWCETWSMKLSPEKLTWEYNIRVMILLIYSGYIEPVVSRTDSKPLSYSGF